MGARHLRLLTSKQEGPKKSALSVSSGHETQSAEKSPAKRYKAIEVWIDLANWAPRLRPGAAPPELIRWMEQQAETPLFPRSYLRFLMEKIKIGSEASLDEAFTSLLWKIWKTLHSIAVESCGGCIPQVQSDYELLLENGVVHIKSARSPFHDFAATLEGIEAKRIRRCPVCDGFFFAARFTKPACSETCGRTLRTRRARGKQPEYERNRRRNQRARELRRTGKWLK